MSEALGSNAENFTNMLTFVRKTDLYNVIQFSKQ